MKKLKVLQLASYSGNIGDNANHAGMRMLLERNLNTRIKYTDLEIRMFYWKEAFFDDAFIDLVNEHDLFIVGGGNYFEMWVPSSSTGTSINISIDKLKRIKSPIMFYSLGCDAGQGAPKSNQNKFRSYLDHLLASDKYLVSVRNDGSLGTINEYFGKRYSNMIEKVPDGGFFIEPNKYTHPELSRNRTNIAVNLAGDMLDIRYKMSREIKERITYVQFADIFGKYLDRLLLDDQSLHVVFVPHIFRDLVAINDVIVNMCDKHRRTRVSVSPYLNGPDGADYIFDMYRRCDLVLGMRFHANVCPIGMGVPTIGLVNYPQVEKVYEELGICGRTVNVKERGYEEVIDRIVQRTIQNPEAIKNRYRSIKLKLDREIHAYHGKVKNWLMLNDII